MKSYPTACRCFSFCDKFTRSATIWQQCSALPIDFYPLKGAKAFSEREGVDGLKLSGDSALKRVSPAQLRRPLWMMNELDVWASSSN
jgi:hypothetical protein